MNNFLETFIQSNTLNFLLVLLFLIWIALKLNIGEKLEHTKNQIKSFVGEAENAKSEAEKRMTDINEKVKRLPSEIQEIERITKVNIESLAKKNTDDINEQIQNIDNNVKRIMDLETKKFKSKLTSIISEASVNIAKENAIRQMQNNRAIHDKYIYDAIDEIDGMNL